MTILETIRVLAPEFSGITDTEVGKWVTLTEPFVSKRKFGKFYEQAIALLACHRMKISGIVDVDSPTGSIADAMKLGSYSEGGVSISYSTSQTANLMTDGELTLTTYGLQYLSLRRMVIIPIKSAGESCP